MSGCWTSRLLCYHHVRVPALIFVLREQVLDHGPTETQPLSNKDCVVGEVDDQNKPSRTWK